MRLPLLPTAVVGAAAAAMVSLGVWQLHRAEWKTGLIAKLEVNSARPAVAWPRFATAVDSLLYRRATGFCLQPTAWRAIAGRNLKDEPGWAHIASCRTGAEGPGMEVDVGWSKAGDPPRWRGGPVSGIIVPDREHRIRLVADKAAPGLLPSKPPTPEGMPNNHLLYAFQWFFFAVAAVVIYLLALRRRQKAELPPATTSPNSAPQ